jgi:hypothetical protein
VSLPVGSLVRTDRFVCNSTILRAAKNLPGTSNILVPGGNANGRNRRNLVIGVRIIE